MPAKRVLISIDERLLERIDRAREQRGMTRSGYLAKLAEADLQASRAPAGDPASMGSIRTIDQLVDPADLDG